VLGRARNCYRRRSTRRDVNGRFVIKQVCDGLLDVHAMLPPDSGSPQSGVVGIVQAHAGETNIVVKLGEEYGVPTKRPRNVQSSNFSPAF
jgi:hypothetical protein